jgi:hypothetical protein
MASTPHPSALVMLGGFGVAISQSKHTHVHGKKGNNHGYDTKES